MQINIYSIEKSQKDEFETITKNYISMSKKFANIKDVIIFNKDIAKAQKNNEAQKGYSKAFDKYLNGYNIILTPEAKELDTMEFSKLFENKLKINFFIAGAFGFNEEFKKRGDKLISLSKLTMSHKIAKIVLFEQIYRALSIINNHPYHK